MQHKLIAFITILTSQCLLFILLTLNSVALGGFYFEGIAGSTKGRQGNRVHRFRENRY